jgi:RNA polymerase primary sigma factor
MQALNSAGIAYIETAEEEESRQEVIEEEEDAAAVAVEDLEAISDDLESIDTDDMVRIYLKEAARIPLLTAEEEVLLAQRIERCRQAQQELAESQVPPDRREKLRQLVQDGRTAREHMIRANARLVVSVAKKYIGRGLPFLDLIQEGNIGLMRAIRNYDYKRGFKFSTYATWWIRQAVTRALAEQSRTIRLPVHMSDQVSRMRRVQHELQQKLGRAPTTEDLAEAMGMLPDKVSQIMQMVRQPISLQTPIGEDQEEVLGDMIEDEATPNPEESTLRGVESELLKQGLETLPPRELMVLQLRYGLSGEEPMSLSVVGERMGITRERARQLEAQAIDRLRNPGKERRKRGRPRKQQTG